MKERPILFSAPMVRAILEGRKTQTRRVVKERHLSLPAWKWREACPYGQPGDHLWVRETHQFDPPDDGTWAYVQWSGCKKSTWRAIPKRFRAPEHVIYAASFDSKLIWRPSIFMPRWASRITLKITDVRVEHLQSITFNDAIAEGIEYKYEKGYTDPRLAFLRLWESINGEDSWGLNPWVWVIEFTQTRSSCQ